MPTGYTIAIEKGCTFSEFVWDCARAFGALVDLRDDTSAPIPKEIKPSTYHLDELTKAKAELKRFCKGGNEQIEKLLEKKYQEDLKYYNEQIRKAKDLRVKYLEMLGQVTDWYPPTSEHTRLKEFMLEQINSSIDQDCSTSWIKPPLRSSVEDFTMFRKVELQNDIQYHEEHYKEECELAAKRTKWIQALMKSVPLPK